MNSGNLAYKLPEMEEDRFLTESSVNRRATTKAISTRETLVGSENAVWKEAVFLRLGNLTRLSENWDSYGAKPVQRWSMLEAVRVLIDLMESDTPIPSIVPTPEGHVQLEWHTNGIDLEIEFVGPALIHVAYENMQTGEEWEGELTYDLTRLLGFVKQLSSDLV